MYGIVHATAHHSTSGGRCGGIVGHDPDMAYTEDCAGASLRPLGMYLVLGSEPPVVSSLEAS